ncbi:MAG: MFS transporter [Thermomicrobiales bacterium]|nr:MAG: MFS transporter [Thermomicrobiales bacterium]
MRAPEETARHATLALALLSLVAFNLRTGLIGVGPLLPDVTDDLHLTHTESSLLVALPTALMGLSALPGGRLVDRFGARSILTTGLALVALAGGLRAAANAFPMLVLLTALFGVGIGIAQPGLPRLGLALFPRNAGLATGVYAGGFFLGSVVASFLTPVLMGFSEEASRWRIPLAVWGGVAGVCLAIWVVGLRHWSVPSVHARASGASAEPVVAASGWSPWRDKKVWIVTLVFSGQGLAYYLLLAWLPSVYQDDGLSGHTAGILFALYNLATFPAMVGLPLLSDRIGSRKTPTILAAVTLLVGALGLALAPTVSGLMWIWPILSGFGVAGLFGMGLLMPVDVAPPGKTGLAAGMVLCVGYLASAAGPVIGGVIKDATGSFERALLLLPVLAIGMIAVRFFVPRPFESRMTVES